MEPITHFLTGACLARAGFNRKTALATATMTLAAEAPDIDVIGSFKNPVFGFAHHRGFTHSFLGLILVQALVVGLVYSIWRIRGRKQKDPNLPPRWGLLFGLAYLAGLTHILLDFTNNYGVRPFWPFWEKWYSWDIVFIVEPIILILLIAGLVLPAFSSLINDEIGVRRKGPQGRLAASVALIGVVALWGIRDYEHRRAVVALQSRTYDGVDPIRASAYPYWLNPFKWYGVVETQDFFASSLVDSSKPEVDSEGRMRTGVSRKKRRSLWPRKAVTLDGSIWTGRSIQLPKLRSWIAPIEFMWFALGTSAMTIPNRSAGVLLVRACSLTAISKRSPRALEHAAVGCQVGPSNPSAGHVARASSPEVLGFVFGFV